MQAIEPIRITAGNFAAYGRYYNLRGEDGGSGPGVRGAAGGSAGNANTAGRA